MTQFVLIGLGTGALYAIGALGIVTIHRGSKVLNLAHGAIAMWGAYLFVWLRDDRGAPAVLAVVGALAAAAAFGIVAYLLAVRPLRNRTPLTRMVSTLGMVLVLHSLAAKIFGTEQRLVRSSLPGDTVHVLGADIGLDRLILLGIAIGIGVTLSTWSARSRFALATRAMAEHERAATALGYSPDLVGSLNWALGSALAAAAGVLVAPTLGLGPTSIALIVVPSLAAALLGGFSSFGLAIVGALGLGVAESIITRYVAVPGWSAAAPFLFVIAALMAQREWASNRLPAQSAPPVAAGRANGPLALAATVGVLLILFLSSTLWVDAVILSACFGILALSLVVIIGYANQISLAQMSIAGLGGFVAARLSQDWNLPFEIAPLVGAGTGAVVGALIGLPAVRVRGINLAVVTVGLGLTAERIVFQNPDYTGGLNGLVVNPPRVFGAEIDAIGHPRGYALFGLFWLAVAVVAVWLLRRSTLGRRMLAMRTNERAAAASGINVAATKLTAFVIASGLAGLAGVLLVFRQPSATFLIFNFNESVTLVAVSVIAGVASIGGALVAGTLVVGGLLYRLIEQIGLVDAVGDYYTLLFGVSMISVLVSRPHGIAARRHPRPMVLPLPIKRAPERAPRPLSATAVTVSFGGVRAVHGASVIVPPGRIVGLIGPNGAGKTTLLDGLCGFVSISSGRIALDGRDLTTMPTHRRTRAGIGRAFQAVELFEDLTVAQNLLVGAESAGRDGGRLPAPALEVIDRFGLRSDLHRLPSQLAQGRRRLIGVARALAGNPAVLLLDEPGAGLSLTESEMLSREMRALAEREGMGVLVVDHDMGLVLSVCDHVIVLVDGRVLAEGPPQTVSDDPAVRAAYLGELGSPTA